MAKGLANGGAPSHNESYQKGLHGATRVSERMPGETRLTEGPVCLHWLRKRLVFFCDKTWALTSNPNHLRTPWALDMA